jgi:hypothetical protein
VSTYISSILLDTTYNLLSCMGGALVDAAGSQTGSLTSATWKLALKAAFSAFVLMLCKIRLLAGRLACGKASH